uniref:Amyloid beta protein binding family B member 3 n=1 Tax=Serinus canaria TaxID=9135 RepID=A0A8C9N2Y1_SERCA
MFPCQAPLLAHAPSHTPRGHRRTLVLLGKVVGCSGQLWDLSPHPISHTLPLCTDNLWSDQSLETDPDLPPGWRKICDSLGTYYWHVPTGTTQWQHPARGTGPGGHTERRRRVAAGRDVDGSESRGDHCGTMRCVGRRWLCRGTEAPRVSAQCFAVRSLGWVEIPEEDLAPGKSSIAVNNCIQQLSNSKGQGSAENQGEGQDLVMILKKDTMSLVDPLDRSLIHRQPILNIRVWGVGCNNGRCQGDFAFVASDKDTCVLKCHVFHCNVPAKGIAKALHEMCSKVGSRDPGGCDAAGCSPCSQSAREPEPSVDILEAVRQSMQTYEALYIGSLPVPRAMGKPTPEVAPACVPHLRPCCPLPIPPCSPAPAPCQALAEGAAQGSREPRAAA